jgi:hypothetical protein
MHRTFTVSLSTRSRVSRPLLRFEETETGLREFDQATSNELGFVDGAGLTHIARIAQTDELWGQRVFVIEDGQVPDRGVGNDRRRHLDSSAGPATRRTASGTWMARRYDACPARLGLVRKRRLQRVWGPNIASWLVKPHFGIRG